MLIAGVDEAGRGPLAGPVFAAAVILDRKRPIEGLRDSKQLSAAARERLAIEIRASAIAWYVAWADVSEIDSINILQATLLAMQRAVGGLAIAPHKVEVDGNQCPKLAYRTRTIVKGDCTVPAISAASILAKTCRDALLNDLDALHPGYGFAHNKGYATPEHLAALDRLGPCAVHRRSFAPVAQIPLPF